MCTRSGGWPSPATPAVAALSEPVLRKVLTATLFASSKERMSALTSKVRVYDLAKDLKIDTKRLIEEVRREGVDVSVPSNSISKELAEKIREKYFPKQPVAAKRAVKIVKKAARPVVEEPAAPEEPVTEAAPPATPAVTAPEP